MRPIGQWKTVRDSSMEKTKSENDMDNVKGTISGTKRQAEWGEQQRQSQVVECLQVSGDLKKKSQKI